MTRFALVVAMLSCAVAADAQTLQLRIQDGRVSLNAQGVPLRSILAEWSRVGEVTILNGERTSAVPIALQLSDVREDEALAMLLRDVSGYVLVPRKSAASGSAFDRIVVLPTSVVAPSAPAAPQRAAAGRFVPPGARAAENFNQLVELQTAREAERWQGAQTEASQMPQGGIIDATRPPGATGSVMPQFRVPPGVPIRTGPEAYAPERPTPTPVAAPTAPPNPFGISAASDKPGVITPVPAPPPQRPPVMRMITSRPPQQSGASTDATSTGSPSP